MNNDVYSLDVRERSNGYMAEMSFKETEDEDNEQVKLPRSREGHVSFMIENQMMIFGGCDIQKGLCFNDVFSLDVEAHPGIWKQIQLLPGSVNKNSSTLY